MDDNKKNKKDVAVPFDGDFEGSNAASTGSTIGMASDRASAFDEEMESPVFSPIGPLANSYGTNNTEGYEAPELSTVGGSTPSGRSSGSGGMKPRDPKKE